MEASMGELFLHPPLTAEEIARRWKVSLPTARKQLREVPCFYLGKSPRWNFITIVTHELTTAKEESCKGQNKSTNWLLPS
jgi:hypothetical protein